MSGQVMMACELQLHSPDRCVGLAGGEQAGDGGAQASDERAGDDQAGGEQAGGGGE